MPMHNARLVLVRDGETMTGPDEGPGIGTAATVDGAVDGAAAPPNAAANDRLSSSTSGAVHGSSKSARPVRAVFERNGRRPLSHEQRSASPRIRRSTHRRNGYSHHPLVALEVGSYISIFDAERARRLEQDGPPRPDRRQRRTPGGNAPEQRSAVPAQLLMGDHASAPLRPRTSGRKELTERVKAEYELVVASANVADLNGSRYEHALGAQYVRAIEPGVSDGGQALEVKSRTFSSIESSKAAAIPPFVRIEKIGRASCRERVL